MNRNITRFQSSALAIRPTTAWTKPTMGGKVRGAFMGLKQRAKNLLARPGIKNAMSRVGGVAGNTVGLVKRKIGFSGERRLASFARRRFLGPKRKSLIRRLALPAAGVGAVAALGGAGYLASRNRKSFDVKIGQAESAVNRMHQQGVQQAINAAHIKATLQERARGRRG